jgi:hypothetical protein
MTYFAYFSEGDMPSVGRENPVPLSLIETGSEKPLFRGSIPLPVLMIAEAD